MTRRRFVTLAGVGAASRRPCLGTRELDGAARLPYQPSTFPTPPFAEFTSGHSTLGAAGRESTSARATSTAALRAGVSARLLGSRAGFRHGRRLT